MKKTLIIAVATLIGVTAIAQTVTSANIVGYSKKAGYAGGFKILAPQFIVDNPDGITIGDAFTGHADQSKIFAHDGTNYTEYTYYSVIPGWFDALFASADGVVIEAGDAVWLKPASGDDTLMHGEVTDAASVTNTLVVGFNLIANPYPVAITLGDLPAPPIADQDKAFVHDGTNYTEYTYYSVIPGWFDAVFTASDSVAIPVGEGFWLDSGSGGDLILNKPF